MVVLLDRSLIHFPARTVLLHLRSVISLLYDLNHLLFLWLLRVLVQYSCEDSDDHDYDKHLYKGKRFALCLKFRHSVGVKGKLLVINHCLYYRISQRLQDGFSRIDSSFYLYEYIKKSPCDFFTDGCAVAGVF